MWHYEQPALYLPEGPPPGWEPPPPTHEEESPRVVVIPMWNDPEEETE